MSKAMRKEVKMLNRVLLRDDCPLLSFVNNRDRYLSWKDTPEQIRDSIRQHQRALRCIHWKPGEWRRDAYANLSKEEQEIINGAWKIMKKLEIKEGEEYEPPNIH